ncbi:MAG TPA: response regulator, partial [Gaiellaceae bacterium]|nr:response regulator [Gaiellaceae bacterium]
MRERATILVVDDDPVVRLMMTAALERDAHVVRAALNGRDALDLLGRGGVDVVLLDVLMPEMDGFTVLERLKGDPDLRHVPGSMVT